MAPSPEEAKAIALEIRRTKVQRIEAIASDCLAGGQDTEMAIARARRLVRSMDALLMSNEPL